MSGPTGAARLYEALYGELRRDARVGGDDGHMLHAAADRIRELTTANAALRLRLSEQAVALALPRPPTQAEVEYGQKLARETGQA